MNQNISNLTDLLYGCNGEILHMTVDPEHIIMATVLILIILLSIFGNSLVILAVFNYTELREVTFVLLCSLAVSDLLSPLARILSIAVSILKGQWIFGCKWCTVSSTVGVFFSASSIVHLCFVTVERFLFIRYPLRHDLWLTKKRNTFILIFIWLLSLAVALIPYFTQSVQLKFNTNMLLCEVYLVSSPHLSFVLLGVYFGIPLFLMLFVYSHITRAAVRQTRTLSIDTLGKRIIKRKQIFQKDWKVVRIVFTVVGMFALLWSPYFVVNVIKAYKPSTLPYWIERMALCTAYTNSCCNWIVYSVLNNDVRTAFMKLLNIKRKKRSAYMSESTNDHLQNTTPNDTGTVNTLVGFDMTTYDVMRYHFSDSDVSKDSGNSIDYVNNENTENLKEIKGDESNEQDPESKD